MSRQAAGKGGVVDAKKVVRSFIFFGNDHRTEIV